MLAVITKCAVSARSREVQKETKHFLAVMFFIFWIKSEGEILGQR